MDDISLFYSAIGRIFAELNIPLSPTLADKHAIEDELKIHGGKPVLPYFKLHCRNYFE